MVYVLDYHGTPMMPTKRYGKVRRMLNNGKAKVIKRTPFTIQLTYETETHYTQPINLGIDPHRSKIGLSAVIINKLYNEVYAAEIIPRQDVSINVKKTKQLRQSRRYRNKKRKSHKIIKGAMTTKKTKYNPATVVFGAETINSIRQVYNILPITKVNMEVSEVPSKKLNRLPYLYIDDLEREISAARVGTFNRDHHTCQWCYGKSNDKILTVKDLNATTIIPDDVMYVYNYTVINSIVTLCKKCRDKYDKIEKDYLSNRKDKKFRSKFGRVRRYIFSNHLQFMKKHPWKKGWFKFKLFEKLKTLSNNYGINNINKFYGQDTAAFRHAVKAENNPINNARIIATDFPDIIEPMDRHFYFKYRKHHDRSLHNVMPKKGGIRNERTPKIVKGFKSYDKVIYLGKKHKEYYGKEFYITKKRKTGYFGLGRADGTTIINSVKYTFLKLIEKARTYSVDIIKDKPNTFCKKETMYNIRGNISTFNNMLGGLE